MKLCFLLTAAATVFLCTSCSMLIRQDPPPAQSKQNDGTQGGSGKESGHAKGEGSLTAQQIGEMSPEELERYMEEKRRRQHAKEFSEGLAEERLTEKDRRRMRMDVTRPLMPEERSSAFPWKSEPGSRSDSLRDSTTFNR